jgi:tetratricopeptide (TPR) repeat protein
MSVTYTENNQAPMASKDTANRTKKGLKYSENISSNPKSEPARKNHSTSKSTLPIPRGETPYALAKYAEYKFRDLNSAEHYYNKAIAQGERIESAVKDLASLLHQRGKTKEACEILEKYQYLFKHDYEKYQNLYSTLKKQIDPTGNCQNKNLKISHLDPQDLKDNILGFFSNPVRIQDVELRKEEVDGKIVYYCILKFNSHSSARKTLEGFHHWDKYDVEWISPSGEVVGDAHYARHKMEEYRKYHPTFDYIVFDRDPHGYIYSLPLDSNVLSARTQGLDNEKHAEKLLGSGLFTTIFKDDIYKD